MASKYSKDTFKADEILLNHIYSHAGYTKRDLPVLIKAVRRGDLAMESLVENAIARVGKLKRVNVAGMDYSDGSDSKKVTVVNQGTRLKPIRGANILTKNKKGVLRIVVVDALSKEVFYFRIPPEFYVGQKQKRRETAIRILFAKEGGKPDIRSTSTTSKEIWSYEVPTFTKLCS